MMMIRRTREQLVLLALSLLLCSTLAQGDNTLQFFMSSDDEARAQTTTIQTAEMLTPFRGAGKYDIAREYVEIEYENVTSQVYIYTPIAENAGGVVDRSMLAREEVEKEVQWPGLVFGHGLCTSAENYEHMLTILASWGFVVMATDEHSYCDFDTFSDGKTVNTTAYTDELRRNVLFLSSGQRRDVNASALAIAGHSMGGGSAINAAAALSREMPDLIKAVVAIAPWNGVEPPPSTLVGEIECPVLLFCSANDSLVPCSGPVTIEIVFGAFRMPFASLIPEIHGQHHGIDWGGGVLAIYENVSESTPAILAVVKDANHLTIVDSDGVKARQMQEYFSRVGLAFTEIDLEPGRVIPTMEYALAFLEWALRRDAQAFDLLWGKEGILLDNRFAQPVSRAATDS
jgi:dienelactone hydrolase